MRRLAIPTLAATIAALALACREGPTAPRGATTPASVRGTFASEPTVPLVSAPCVKNQDRVAVPGNAVCVEIYGITLVAPGASQALDCRGYTVSGYEVES